ncbi:hypothetical protein QCA50_013702 [Cerrena zonata]|uniref:Uncharacterized protein n=1 Tax=Cerrena zonata TaxID=2478898 RepID=A0AAW0FVW8_9APHY
MTTHHNSPQDLNAATAEFYSANPQIEDNRLKLHRIEFEVTLRTVLSLIPEGIKANILDVGGGTGPYSFALAAAGHSVTLIDLSPRSHLSRHLALTIQHRTKHQPVSS